MGAVYQNCLNKLHENEEFLVRYLPKYGYVSVY